MIEKCVGLHTWTKRQKKGVGEAPERSERAKVSSTFQKHKREEEKRGGRGKEEGGGWIASLGKKGGKSRFPAILRWVWIDPREQHVPPVSMHQLCVLHSTAYYSAVLLNYQLLLCIADRSPSHRV